MTCFAQNEAILDRADGCTIILRVQPGASRNRVSGVRDGTLRVSVTAPPNAGRANAAVLELLAATLRVAGSRLRIVRGHSSRDKVVAVEGLTVEEVQLRLDPASPSEGAQTC